MEQRPCCSAAIISLQRYAALLSHADIARTFAISLLGRLPIGLTGLAILPLVQTSSESFAQGGAAATCYLVGLAATAPLLGRAIDRYGLTQAQPGGRWF